MNKLEFKEFLQNKNTKDIKKKGHKYSINGSKYLAIDKLREYFWKCFSIQIEDAVLKEVLNEESVNENVLEKEIRDKLAKELNGEIEIKTPVGFIDVLTIDEIIEVKKAGNWKSALGQIISYGKYYPDKQKRIHLYGDMPKNNFDNILQLCKENQVKLTYEY